MKLTSSLLLDDFKKKHEISNFNLQKPYNIETLMIWDNTPLKPSFLYIIYSSQLPIALEQNVKCTFISIGEPEFESSHISNIMYVPEKSNLTTILNIANTIIYKFNCFIEELTNTNNLTLNEILQKTGDYLNLDFYISDEAFKVVSMLIKDGETEEQIRLKNYYSSKTEYSLEDVKNIMNNPQLTGFEEKDEPYFLHDDISSSILYNFKESGVYIGAVLAIKFAPSLNQSDIELFTYISKVLEIKFKSTHSRKINRTNLKTFLKTSVSSNILIVADLENKLAKIGWDINDTYRVIMINLFSSDFSTVRNYFTNIIEQKHSNCIVFDLDTNLICVECLSKKKEGESDITNNLEDLFSNIDYKIGISKQGLIKNILSYEKQCQIALKIGNFKDIEKNIYYFDNYALMHLLNNCSNDLNIFDVCHSSLSILKKHDLKNNGTLFKTLRTYLENNFHLQKTADALFIHRTTLLYRLETIKKLCQLDLRDFNTVIHIGFSYLLLDYNQL